MVMFIESASYVPISLNYKDFNKNLFFGMNCVILLGK